MANDTQEKLPSAPYVSWRTFTFFIGNIKGKVPIQIDTSLLKNMSGTARSQLLSALKFLRLIEANGTVKDDLRELAEAYNTPEWKSALGEFIKGAYERITAHLDIKAATPGMLRERFRSLGGVDGGTVDSAMRFYLSALKEADLPFSPHLVMRQRAPKGSGTRRRAITKARNALPDDDDNNGEIEMPEGTFKIPFDIIGISGSAYLPEDVSLEQWDAISGYVKTVIGYRQKAQPKV